MSTIFLFGSLISKKKIIIIKNVIVTSFSFKAILAGIDSASITAQFFSLTSSLVESGGTLVVSSFLILRSLFVRSGGALVQTSCYSSSLDHYIFETVFVSTRVAYEPKGNCIDLCIYFAAF